LGARRIDAPVAGTFGKVALDNVRADDQHERMLARISKKWKKEFPFLGRICQ
jgi:hypothetical protein